MNNRGVDEYEWPIFRDGDSITVVTRTPTRVFFESKEAAKEWNYVREILEEDKAEDTGFSDFFTGLKAEARDLWKDIQRGQHKWVQYANANGPEDQRKYIEEADIVISAKGYQSSHIPLLDEHGAEIKAAYNAILELENP